MIASLSFLSMIQVISMPHTRNGMREGAFSEQFSKESRKTKERLRESLTSEDELPFKKIKIKETSRERETRKKEERLQKEYEREE